MRMSGRRLRGSRVAKSKAETKKTYKESESSSNESDEDDTPVIKAKSKRANHRKVALRSKPSMQQNTTTSEEDTDSVMTQRLKRKRQASSHKPGKRHRRIEIVSSEDEDSTDEDEESNKSESAGSKEVDKGKLRRKLRTRRSKIRQRNKKEPNTGRKDIKKILKDEDLQEQTREAEREERERLRRLKERENGVEQEDDNIESSPEKTPHSSVVFQKDPLVQVSPYLAKYLRPHQIEGVRFMWNNLVESTERAKNSHGGGCILAHCMGLGKTLQTIACVHSFLKTKHLAFERVLVVAPLNTVRNWMAEFVQWCEDGDELQLYNFAEPKTNKARVHMLKAWKQTGGVLILGYDMYRIMTTKIRYSQWQKVVRDTLVDPGPDIVVCDEGHMLKNADSHISKQINRIQTKRRVVLTGTPLQNNLIEYHCMVDFVKPDLLGSLKEFRNRFVNPILNGQHMDSTDHDVNIMKKRSHVLHQMLEGFVQRKDYMTLKPYLSSKYEYVLKVRLTPLQIKLYQHYLDTMTNRGANSAVVNSYGKGASLFADYQNLMRVWTHPKSLLLHTVKREKILARQEERQFIEESMTESDEWTGSSSGEETEDKKVNGKAVEEEVPKQEKISKSMINLDSTESENDNAASSKTSRSRRGRKRAVIKGSSSDENLPNGESESDRSESTNCSDSSDDEDAKGAEKIPHRRTRSRAGAEGRRYRLRCAESSSDDKEEEVLEEDRETPDWYTEILPEDKKSLDDYQNSLKIAILFEILRLSEERQEKVLVFSQSLISLDLIEEMLCFSTPNGIDEDAGVDSDNSGTQGRRKWFKNVDYFRMDGATQGHHRQRWINAFNDENDTRSRLFLISTKAGSLGVNLIGANRVVIFDACWNPSHDTQSMFRVYRLGQMKKCYIYRFIAEGTMEEKIYQRQVSKQSLAFRVVDEQQINRHFTASSLAEMYTFNPSTPDATRPEPTPIVPKDEVLSEILSDPRTRHMIASYHEHDSLLDHQVNEELTEEERKAAWEEYEMVKTGGYVPRPSYTTAQPAVPPDTSMQQMFMAANNYNTTRELDGLLTRLSKMINQAYRQYQACEMKTVESVMKHLKDTPLYSNSNEETLKAIAMEVNLRLSAQRNERYAHYSSLQKQFRALQAKYIALANANVSAQVSAANFPLESFGSNPMMSGAEYLQFLATAGRSTIGAYTASHLPMPSRALLLEQLASSSTAYASEPQPAATVTTISEVVEVDDEQQGTSNVVDG